MNKVRSITVICWAISAAAFLGLVIWIFASGIFLNVGIRGFGGISSFQPVGTYSVSADSINSMRIDWTAGAVSIDVHSGDDIQITEFAQGRLRDNEYLEYNFDGETLTINFTAHRAMRNNMPPKQLEVLIPYALSQSFESVQVNTVSGRVDIRDIHAESFTAGTISGRIELHGIISQTLNASTTSGRIEVFGIQADEITLRTTSGRIGTTDTQAGEMYLRTISGRIETLDTQAQSLRTQTTSGRHGIYGSFGSVNATSTSGRHELSGSFGNVNVRSTSGRVEITSTTLPEHLAAHATSGRISVTVPNDGAISIAHSTTSGRFTSAIPVTTNAGADAQFNLSTSSGRISVFALPG